MQYSRDFIDSSEQHHLRLLLDMRFPAALVNNLILRPTDPHFAFGLCAVGRTLYMCSQDGSDVSEESP